jgi:hypothetical protein
MALSWRVTLAEIVLGKCPDREIQRIEFRVNQHTHYLNLV